MTNKISIWTGSISLLMLLVLIPGESVAQSTNKIGTSAAVFLRIPVGARASALGSAVSSIAEDESVLYWNPGGLSRLKDKQFLFDYSDWLPGLYFGYAGASIPMGLKGTLGLQATYLTTDEMDITTPAAPMGTGQTYTASSNAIGVSYANSLTDKFSIGGTMKLVQERIYNSNATGLVFDVGTLFDTPFWGIRLGVSVANVGTKFQMGGEDLNTRVDIAPDQEGNNQSIVGELKTDRFDPPTILRIGISDDLIKSNRMRLTWMVDGVSPNDDAASVNLGLETGFYNDMFHFRAGYNDLFLEESIRGLTFGAGFKVNSRYSNIQVDYGYQTFKYLSGVNRFTVIITI